MATIIGSTNSSVWTFKLETIEGQYDIVNNTSPLTVNIYIGRVSTSGSYMYGADISGTVSCTGCKNQQFRYKNQNRVDVAAGGWLHIGTVTFSAVPHDSNGSKTVYVAASFSQSGVSPSSGSAGSNVVLTTIPRKAEFASVSNFDDKTNPKIYFNHPAGNALELQAGIFCGNEVIANYRKIDGTKNVYEFEDLDEFKENIWNASIDKHNDVINVTFKLATQIGNKFEYSESQSVTCTVTDCDPTLDPTVVDEGSNSTKLTGDGTANSNTIIKYHNYVVATFNSACKKGANIVSRSVRCGNRVSRPTGDYTTFSNVEDKTFIFTITDSRGKTVEKKASFANIIDYKKLTCDVSVDTVINEELADITLNISGDYYNGSFGSTIEITCSNTLTLEYRYKDSNIDFPGTWTPILPSAITISNGQYTASAVIDDKDYKGTYTVQVRAKDKINTGGVQAKDEVVKIIPTFDWSEEDFNFNVPVTIQGRQVRTGTPTDRIARAYTQETEIAYATNSFIRLFRDNSSTDLYNTDIATFGTNGIITIKKDMTALINVHIVSSNSNGRSWIRLVNYETFESGARYADCVAYGQYTTSQISIILNLQKGTEIGIYTVEPMTINSSGLVGSYIEIMEL